MPTRIQRQRTRGWRKPDNCVIVDRTSRFGNPFTIAEATELGYDEPRTASVGAFKEWIRGNRDMWQSDEGDQRRERILASLHLLRGKDVACPCGEGEACHGDDLLELANRPDLDEWIGRVRARVERNRTWRGEDPMYSAGDASAQARQDDFQLVKAPPLEEK